MGPVCSGGAPFSAQYVVPAERQVHGRFDLRTSPVLYLAETPEHAVAELLRPFSGRALKAAHLVGAGKPLALVGVTVEPSVPDRLADLADPAVLLAHGIRPDALTSRDRAVTQSISRRLYSAGLPGFRWWSALHGDWHAAVLFLDRLRTDPPAYDTPEVLSVSHPAVLAAARALNMDVPTP